MIVLIIGPMFSGKSTYILNEERKAIISKKKSICVKHSIDTRYSTDSNIINHNKQISISTSIASSTLKNILNALLEYDVILIDEGQFFNDLVEIVQILDKHDKNIFISGLSSDFKKEAFTSISELIPKADKIIHMTSICTICSSDASFTTRLISNLTSNTQTLIGGVELYEPRCRKCFV